MENQTRFDLNAAVENWRNELAAQPNFASDDRRELETHLRDAIAGFQQRGLNDEESFWLACKRVGQPPQLSEEFVKADSAKIWREKILWIMIALFAINIWQSFIVGLETALRPLNSHYYDGININNVFPDWYLGLMASWQKEICQGFLNNLSPYQLIYVIEQLIFCLPIVWLALSIARGRTIKKFFAWHSLFDSRRRFIIVASILFLMFKIIQSSVLALGTVRMMQHQISQGAHISYGNGELIAQPIWTQFFWQSFLSINPMICPVAFIVVIACLLPTQNQKTPKRA